MLSDLLIKNINNLPIFNPTNKFLVGGQSGKLFNSANGTTYTQNLSNSNTSEIRKIIHDGSRYILKW